MVGEGDGHPVGGGDSGAGADLVAVVFIAGVHDVGHAELAEIAEAGGLFGLIAGAAEGGEADGDEDGDNGNDDKEFDEGECGAVPRGDGLFHCRVLRFDLQYAQFGSARPLS